MASKTTTWSQIQLGKVLSYVDQLVELDDETEYTTITVKRNHGGLEAREKLFGFQIRTKKQFKLIPEAFIISRVQCWHQAYAIVPDTIPPNMIASTNYDQFVISPEVDSRFFWWYSHSPIFTEVVRSCAFGVVIEKMVFNRDKWLQQTIPLPPLEEQRRIVARIEELVAGIEEARGLRREAVEETEKLLASSITRVLRTIRDEAKDVTVEEVAHSVTDGDHQPPPKADFGIPFIFISNVVKGKIDFSNCKWVSPEYFASIQSNRLPKRGDVLYTAVGATYGIPCLVDTDEPFCFQRHIAIIKPDLNQILPKYLKWVLSSSKVYEQATKAATGSAQPTVPLRGIRNLKFTLPSLHEQHHIVAYLDDLQAKVNSLKQLQSETSAELDALLPSILDKAFKGEL